MIFVIITTRLTFGLIKIPRLLGENVTEGMALLTSKKDRREWEKLFASEFIKPTFQVIFL